MRVGIPVAQQQCPNIEVCDLDRGAPPPLAGSVINAVDSFACSKYLKF